MCICVSFPSVIGEISSVENNFSPYLLVCYMNDPASDGEWRWADSSSWTPNSAGTTLMRRTGWSEMRRRRRISWTHNSIFLTKESSYPNQMAALGRWGVGWVLLFSRYWWGRLLDLPDPLILRWYILALDISTWPLVLVQMAALFATRSLCKSKVYKFVQDNLI